MTLLPPVRRHRATTFADRLEEHGTRAAVVADSAEVTYADLGRLVAEAAGGLADGADGGRRLVAIESGAGLGTLVAYLAALREGHPVLLAPAGAPFEALATAYDPDVVVRAGDAGASAAIDVRRRGSAHDLHPDLALLLSTSGSTGAAKVVRLSHANLEANATSIAAYLALTPADRAVTSLPMAYCYGLSVVHSHLAAGGSLVLTDRSVLDEAFWEAFTRHGATSFAAVPHTFELLDRAGFAARHLPTLRYVTQAGGRLDPDVVRRYARLGRRRGWDLVVMYGQTEATARMAYLPPASAADHPGAIGVAIPGGTLRIDEPDAEGVGELVYVGPNVMLGYAAGPADLALGRTVDELRTGDLARRGEGGLFEIVGRRRRFVKPFGLRVDLDEVEAVLRREGIAALCAGDDRHLVLATHPDDVGRAAARVQALVGLPAGAVHVHGVDPLPRLANGKPDHARVLALGRVAAPGEGVRGLYAESLQRTGVADDDTFVSLGGDSLSYVELSVRLEELLGSLPEDWPSTTVRELEERRVGATDGPRPRSAVVETTVVLRAAAIALVVATHAHLVDLKGGAHLLLGVAGWNFARFQLPVAARRLAASVGRIAAPSIAWLAVLAVVTGGYDVANLALVHTQTGPAVWGPRWRYWFVETLVQTIVVTGAVLSVPRLRRLERDHPFPFAAVALGAALALRFATAGDGTARRPQEVAWFFFLGWAAQRARSAPQRLGVSVVAVVAVHGFFGQPARETLIAAGFLALVWVRAVPLVRPLPRVVSRVAAASLVVYLTHWAVYPLLRADSPALAFAASLAVGLAAHGVLHRALPRLRL